MRNPRSFTGWRKERIPVPPQHRHQVDKVDTKPEKVADDGSASWCHPDGKVNDDTARADGAGRKKAPAGAFAAVRGQLPLEDSNLH